MHSVHIFFNKISTILIIANANAMEYNIIKSMCTSVTTTKELNGMAKVKENSLQYYKYNNHLNGIDNLIEIVHRILCT